MANSIAAIFARWGLKALEQREIAGISFTRYLFPLPCRPPLGYHRFEIVGEPGAHLSLIVAPHVTWRSLTLRQAYPDLFRHGDYYALNAVGQKVDHVCALARHYQGLEAIVVAPRLIVRLLDKNLDKNGNEPLGAAVWQDTSVVLPLREPRPYQNVFTGETVYPEADGGTCCLPLAALLTHFPLALLRGIP